jgi:isoamylase
MRFGRSRWDADRLRARASVEQHAGLDAMAFGKLARLLRWVIDIHVDGLRFELASLLSPDVQGHPLPSPPVLGDIESDLVLAHLKLIAEAWDAAGFSQVGRFVGDSWQEWDGRFGDNVRSFLKADDGTVRALVYLLFGSSHFYAAEEREPEQSINFVTDHDGLTLNDLASSNAKQNGANDEGNRDGSDDNRSWSRGVGIRSRTR